ncbi:MAG: YbaB/EbfC family nucleoid-associated protein [Synergistetes bacterium]|nr:YbaB/EbfC family nucleoid-associated protein [Synergistota bacterium]MCX8127371.1 YbaB/EbfC family nucleoid-associated protein [Synergistota bacterium]MDW8192235.1 YbaB/EbfC family nucleoid-associated protein [Synergistota bacterium]
MEGRLLKQFQEKILKIQEELASQKVEGSAGGGMVRVIANGQQEILEVHIESELLNSEDIDMLSDLIVAATNDALRKARELAMSRMGSLLGGMKLPWF